MVYLQHIHDGNQTERQEYIENIKSEKSMVVQKGVIQDNTYKLTLHTIEHNNYINYTINSGNEEELPYTIQSGDVITLSAGDAIYYEECKSGSECYKRNMVYFSGKEINSYYPIPRFDQVYMDQTHIDSLRNDYLWKRHIYNNYQDIKSDLNNNKTRNSSIEDRIEEINKRISELQRYIENTPQT